MKIFLERNSNFPEIVNRDPYYIYLEIYWIQGRRMRVIANPICTYIYVCMCAHAAMWPRAKKGPNSTFSTRTTAKLYIELDRCSYMLPYQISY